MAKSKTLTTNAGVERCGATELSFIVGGMQSGTAILEASLEILKTKQTLTIWSSNHTQYLFKWTENMSTHKPAHGCLLQVFAITDPGSN